ncbi:hypothetical protein CR203_24450 [Salipaludibacillus neizhouensis]|uniref:CD-NTase associated protein 4-like DNA endonuclease domain-containing protein n=1 Tax=Salipaludibacillus neizhouensis TaxID=885475 RepID=A0A3A9JWC5_9BACI|nr:hypothetical protein [Salipaludibacillus neizhouensis]RKL64777.1 hypothetical protein CR203_24450 [Salipaludibacillus neizhouensis]
MSYIIQSTEKVRSIGSEYETKALLYLMNFRLDSNEINYYVIDFFNDLTGMSSMGDKLWDIQSKASKNTNAKALGREMVTLYKNYMSSLTFNHYILFVGGLAKTIRIDNNKNFFGIENVTEKALKSITLGLKEESQSKTYIDSTKVTDENVENFLKVVQIVVDDKKNSEYVKSIIKTSVKLLPSDEVLDSIFDEVKDKQSLKKNSIVENIVINTSHEALNYSRHLTGEEIRLMAISRIINRNPLDIGVPASFYDIIRDLPTHKKKDYVLNGQIGVAKAISNKNNIDNFWIFFESVYFVTLENPDVNVNAIFDKLDKNLMGNCPEFDLISIKYFIATVKDGIL